MNTLFELSFALVWGVVLLEALVLRETLAEVVRIARLQGSAQHSEGTLPAQLRKGTPAPEFITSPLEADQALRTSDLKGRSTIILFISPRESASPAYEKLAASIHALWHRSQGQFYLICSGAERPCRNLLRDYAVKGVGPGRIPLILDENRTIADSFMISATPMAVMLDEDAQVSRYGQPIVGGEEHGLS